MGRFSLRLSLICGLLLLLVYSTNLSQAFSEFNSIEYLDFAYPRDGEAKLDETIRINTVLGLNGYFNISFSNYYNSSSYLTIDPIPTFDIHKLTTLYNESGRIRTQNLTEPNDWTQTYKYQIPPNSTWIVKVTQYRQEYETDVLNLPEFRILFGVFDEKFQIIEPINGTAKMKVVISDVVYGTFRISDTNSLGYEMSIMPFLILIILKKHN